MKRKFIYEVEVEFDDDLTDADSIGNALDVLMDTAKGTPGVLEDYGDVWIGGFFPKAEKPAK